MKKLLFTCVLMLLGMLTYAQNATEAKMAYQLAEEKFDAKQYDEALDYLKKAETALGTANPPMLYLRIMITNQIVTAKESTEAYNNLEKAIADFEQHRDKNALGEEKLMEVYRVRTDLEKRKAAFEQEFTLKQEYEAMVSRLATKFPKTHVSEKNFWQSVPTSWATPLSKDERKEFRKQKKNILYIDNFYFGDIQPKQLLVASYNVIEENVRWMRILKLVNKDVQGKKSRKVTIEEVCELLGISVQTWQGLTSGQEPMIERVESEYGNTYAISFIGELAIDEDGATGKSITRDLLLHLYVREDTEMEEYGEFIQVTIVNNN